MEIDFVFTPSFTGINCYKLLCISKKKFYLKSSFVKRKYFDALLFYIGWKIYFTDYVLNIVQERWTIFALYRHYTIICWTILQMLLVSVAFILSPLQFKSCTTAILIFFIKACCYNILRKLFAFSSIFCYQTSIVNQKRHS